MATTNFVPGTVITSTWLNEVDQVVHDADGANYVSFTPAGTGAVSTTVQDKLRHTVSVLDFGAVGDGISNDQAAVAAAVASAYANGVALYWAGETCLTTATIPNFHDVKHIGRGIVKRGANLFYVDPTMWNGVTNNLFVSTTGNDTNDGLSTTEARLTTQSAGDTIYKYGWSDINWVVNFSAGTYNTTGATFSKPFPSSNRVQFKGVDVGAGVQPTVIIQATTPTTNTIGWYFQNYIRVKVSDINFKSFRTGATPNANLLGIGLSVDGRCDVWTTNVWTDDCDQGIYCTNGVQIRVQAGRHGFNAVNGANIQLIRHCAGSIGYGGTTADISGVTGTAMIGGSYGVLLQEFSMAHTDFCYYSAQTLSGVLCNTSRIHSVSSIYNTCLVGIDARLGSNVGNTTNTFTACGHDVIVRSRSTLAGVSNIDSTDFSPPTKQVSVSAQTTQSTSPVNIFTKNFVAKEFQLRGTGFELKLFGEVVGTAGTKTVVVTLGSTTLLTAVIAAATTDYEINVKLVQVTAATSQYTFTRIHQNGVVGVYVKTVTIAEDLTAATTLTVTHQVANAADINRVSMIELEMTH